MSDGWQGTAKSLDLCYPCNCVGPQKGEPMCPCRMRGVIIRNGHYIQPEVDLGPVPEDDSVPWDED